MLQKFSGASGENARIAQEDIFGLQNSKKAIIGEYGGLQDAAAMSRIDTAEREREKAYMAKHSGEPNPWNEISNAVKVNREIYDPLTYVERMRGFSSDLAFHARTLVRVAEEKSKPNGDRLREYRDSGLPSLEQELLSTAPVYKNLETATLALSLTQMQEALRPENAAVKVSLNGKSPEEAAKALIAGTKLEDVAVRKRLYEGGKAAGDARTGPMIVLNWHEGFGTRAGRQQFHE